MTALPTLALTVDAVVIELEDGQRTVLRSSAAAARLRDVLTAALINLTQIEQDRGTRRDRDVAIALNEANRAQHQGHEVFANVLPAEPSRVVPIQACGCAKHEACDTCTPGVRR